MMAELLVFLLCFAVGTTIGYLVGVRRGKIVLNLKTQEMNEMADRLADLETYFQDIDEVLDLRMRRKRG